MKLKTLKHLTAATTRKAANGAGTCFYRAAAMVLDHPPAVLCIGVLAGLSEEELKSAPGGASEDFIHAWVEVGEKLFAPSFLTKTNSNIGPFARGEYYAANGVRDIKRLSRSNVLKLSREHGLSAHLIHDKPITGIKRFVEILLDASKIDYVVEDGLVFPAVRGRTRISHSKQMSN